MVKRETGVEGDAGVALFFGGVKVGKPFVGMERPFGELFREGADFLEADDVGIGLSEPVHESLANGSAKAVDVPTDDFHGFDICWE